MVTTVWSHSAVSSAAKPKNLLSLKCSRFFAALRMTMLLFFLPTISLAMEIPLEGGGKKAKVATVDMHKIFEAFPETERAREELYKMIQQKKKAITEKKEEIAKLKAEIELLKKPVPQVSTAAASLLPETTAPLSVNLSTSSTPNALVHSTAAANSISVATAAADSQLKEKEALLLSRESELGAFIGVSQGEIDSLEEGKTMGLLARIYQILQKIAAEEGYTIVLNKDDILYGEGAVDLTQAVISKLTLEFPKRK